MEEHRFLFANFLILLFGLSSTERCDRTTTARVQEGNIGPSGVFNWLGVLSVHLHDGDKIRMALTGIILIKMKHAIANADDIVRIPRGVFESDSRAMFLTAWDTPWFIKPASYVTHPEYEYSTLNSIAIIVFNLDSVNDFPLNPICLPTGAGYNTSKHLYLTGFTDENQVMEKIFYKIQYLEKTVCEEFYNRAGLSSQKRIPSAYLCGYAPSNVTQCVWDNGMALVSNASGPFYLIGFTVHGPGCAAPARFIDLFQYFYWINSVTNPDELYDESNLRRYNDDEFIPVHELFTKNGSLRMSGKIVDPADWIISHQFVRYPFETNPLKHHIVRPDEDEKSVLIFHFKDTWEQFTNACSAPKELLYRENFKLTSSPKMKGSVTYKLSLYDQHNAVASCVRLTVESTGRSDAILSFKEGFNYKEGVPQETPEDMLQVLSGTHRHPGPGQAEGGAPDSTLPKFINDDHVISRRLLNCDLYIKLEFIKKATLKFEMFAEPGPLNSSRSWSNYTATTANTEPTDTVTTKSNKKLKLRLQKPMPYSLWGQDFWKDNTVRDDELLLVPNMEVVQETESAARSARAPGAVVVACWLISVL